jgi:multidrug resistance efflux pump
LLEVNVKDGDRGPAAKLGALDDTVAPADRPVLEAQLARAEAQLDLARKGARGSDVRAAKAQLSAADAAIAALDTQLKRVGGLFDKNAIPKATLDDLMAKRDEAKASRDAISERLRTLEDGSRPEKWRSLRGAGRRQGQPDASTPPGRYVPPRPLTAA